MYRVPNTKYPALRQKPAARSQKLPMLTATKAKVSPGKLLIDGLWVEGSGRAFDTINPPTGEVLTQVAEATQADVDRAVASARKAFEDQSVPRRKISPTEPAKPPRPTAA